VTPGGRQARVEDGPAPAPEESRWGFSEGEEIAPGRTALKLLGGGFRYEAYLAWDERLHSLVVVKVVRPGLCEDPHALEGLAAEVEMLDRLDHPVLLRGFGADLEGPRPHVVLEHLEGPRLSSLLRRYGPLQAEQVVPLGLQLCAAAHYMAEEGVAHLDIKPSNIIMGAPARLIDLSVARTHEECRSLRSPVGTDAYMAPEQCRPARGIPPGPAADVFGIGVTLFRAASGERPFDKGDPDSSVPEERWPQLRQPPVDLTDMVRADVTEPIMRALEHDPAQRPNAVELADALEPVLHALPKPRISKLKPRPARARRR
jgi:eukaryotic-like serine/threonine-protein kinase